MTPGRDRARTFIERACVSAIIRTENEALAERAMRAAVDGGFRVVEFTLTTPGALSLIERFAADKSLLVGAGTVMTTRQAREAVDAGAMFLVSPICDSDVVICAAELDVASIPGAYTPTEMETAHRLGADFVKVFPAPMGGVQFIHSIRGPLPHLRLFPTAGPTPDNFIEYLAAGCVGVGFVRSLFRPEDLENKNFDAIRDRASLIIKRLGGHLDGASA